MQLCCYKAKMHDYLNFMLNVIMLSVVAPAQVHDSAQARHDCIKNVQVIISGAFTTKN